MAEAEADRAKIFLDNLKQLLGVKLDAEIGITERQKIGRLAGFKRDGNKWLLRVCTNGLARRHSGKTGQYLQDLAKALGLYRPDDLWIEGQKRIQLVRFAMRRLHSVSQDQTSPAATLLKKFGDDWVRREIMKAAAQWQIDPAMSDDDVYGKIFIPALKAAIKQKRESPIGDDFGELDIPAAQPATAKVVTEAPIGDSPKAPEPELTPEQKIRQNMIDLFTRLVDDISTLDGDKQSEMMREIGGMLVDWRQQLQDL